MANDQKPPDIDNQFVFLEQYRWGAKIRYLTQDTKQWKLVTDSHLWNFENNKYEFGKVLS